MTKNEVLKKIKKAAEENEAELILSDAGLKEIPPEIWQLTNLRILRLEWNSLTYLPPEVGLLKNLEELYLSGNNLRELPPEIGQLKGLLYLWLPVNKLSKLPPELGKLTNLFGLDLTENHLTELPEEFNQLTGLYTLYLSGNRFTDFPLVTTRLTNLRRLYLDNNKLTSLPSELHQLLRLIDFRLDGNWLPIPPEILKTHEPSVIINYYFEHRVGQKKPLNEAKVLVLGQGSVGKTSLVKGLMGEEFNPRENKTEGIDIQRWEVECGGQPVRLNVWDFGGQEIMHATHQFFLTKRSLYVLVLDARLGEEENRVEYWLKIIQSFGKDSPVVVVGNKIDQQRLDVDRRGLQAKYPNIRAFVETACPTGKGVGELKEIIAREIGQLEHVHDQLLVSWFAVKERLEGMKEDYIPYHEYERVCGEEGVSEELSRTTLIGFLHDLGLVLNFRDDPRLAGMGVLNPEWVTNSVYKILNSHVLFQNKGVLERASLSQILDAKKYPKDKHLFIMDMMRKFELCFDFEGERDNRFLIPDLLTREEPDTGEWAGALAFQYHYNVLPSSIISRFIVRMHQSISKQTLWRTGVVLKNNGNKALVKADIEDRKIFVWVGGPEESRRRFLEVIRSHFDSIHKTIPGIVADEKVPLPARPDIAVDYKHLLRLELKGIEKWIPEGLEEEVNVKRLLDGIETERSRRERHEGRMREERLERPSPRVAPPATAFAEEAPAASDAGTLLAELTKIKMNLDAGSERFARRCVYAYVATLFVVGATLAALTYAFGWDTMEPWTYFIGAFALVGTYAYFALTLREFTPNAIYEQLVERKKLKNYRAAGFDLEKFKRLTQQINGGSQNVREGGIEGMKAEG